MPNKAYLCRLLWTEEILCSATNFDYVPSKTGQSETAMLSVIEGRVIRAKT